MMSKKGIFFLGDAILSFFIFTAFISYIFLQGSVNDDSISPSYSMSQTFLINLNDLCSSSNETCPSNCLYNSTQSYIDSAPSYHSLYSHLITLNYFNNQSEITPLLFGNGTCIGLNTGLLDDNFNTFFVINDTYYSAPSSSYSLSNSSTIYATKQSIPSYVINRTTNTTVYLTLNFSQYYLDSGVRG